jgi:hypothetical protein
MRSKYDLAKMARGFVRFSVIDEKSKKVLSFVEKKNLILYGAADILGQLLAGESTYAIAGLYIEFQNTAGVITPPTVTRADGRIYYDDLVSSLDTDFLRVPLTTSPGIEGSSDDYNSNLVTFFGVSDGSTGFHGKTFSQAANSHIFGAALIATPTPASQSSDVVFSRVYIGDAGIGWTDAIEKVDGQQVGVTWGIEFQ